jgi:hypothetical protein
MKSYHHLSPFIGMAAGAALCFTRENLPLTTQKVVSRVRITVIADHHILLLVRH